MSIFGFDFGTTNSLISVVRGDHPVNFLDDEGLPVPSIVCYDGPQPILGRAAKKRLERAGLGVQGGILRSPKIYLGQRSVIVNGVEMEPESIVADIVRHIVQQARSGARYTGDISQVVVTIPVDFGGYKRRALRSGFSRAGLQIVQYIHEPLAALYGLFRAELSDMLRRYRDKLILVFDWGGGTLDLTLCRVMQGMIVQVLNDGTDEVGGDMFDETIMNRLIRKVTSGMPFRSYAGARARLMDRCERAKIDLSSRDSVSVYLDAFFKDERDDTFDYTLGRGELEEIVGPLIRKGFERMERGLESAGYLPEQVGLCVAIGGISNMPSVRRRLHEWFGADRVCIPDGTNTLTAEGAAWIANDKVRLHLAKNVELLLSRNSYVPVVHAGTVMPVAGEVQLDKVHLYCTDPRDGVAKFQICTPKRPGLGVLPGVPRTALENLAVKVDDRAHAFRERLEFDVCVDEDLILTAHARSLNRQDERKCEIHNLEFGLRFGTEEANAGLSKDTDLGNDRDDAFPGSLSVRPNVANHVDQRLVPGEFLYTYDPEYFDVRRDPPAEQVHERLYYEPCAVCGRAANDPACCSA